jgi:LPS sulfotransferase NodH
VEDYFSAHSIQPFKVVYEDFVGSYETTVVRILNFLGITSVPDLGLESRKLRQQADAMSEKWVQSYLETLSR